MVEHIQQLLFKHSCIVVPGFGAFMAHTAPAVHDPGANELHPPKKNLSFHPRLNHDDGLLLQHIIKDWSGQAEEAKRRIEETAEQWNAVLDKGEALVLEGLGSLKRSSSERVEFIADSGSNYLPSSFGLASISALPKDATQTAGALADQIGEPAERGIHLKTVEEIEEDEAGILPWLKYASMILLLISVTLTAFYFYNQDQKKDQAAREEANILVSSSIGQGTYYKTSPLPLPDVEIEVEKYHVMAGAFRIESNAARKVAQLRSEGYEAEYLGVNEFDLHQVSYAGFENFKEAKRFLTFIKSRENTDAWILTKK